jgi:hypothetical protein
MIIVSLADREEGLGEQVLFAGEWVHISAVAREEKEVRHVRHFRIT